jgi:hypothetical protein
LAINGEDTLPLSHRECAQRLAAGDSVTLTVLAKRGVPSSRA